MNNLIYSLVKQKQYRKLQPLLQNMKVQDAAEFIEELDAKEAAPIFALFDKKTAAEVFSYLTLNQQLKLVDSLGYEETRLILHELRLDDKVDVLEELPANVVKKILQNSAQEDRALINRFLNYEVDTAGSIMTTEYLSIRANLTVDDALATIRKKGQDKETIYIIYVTDDTKKLIGVLSLRDIVTASRDDKITDLMEKDVIFVYTDTDKEIVASEFSKYGYMAFPVVDGEQRLTGIVTYDDIFDVIEEETTEDFHKMASMRPSDNTYLDESPVNLAKNRLFWLTILMLAGTFVGNIIELYNPLLSKCIILSAFIPMITGTSGNAGIQSATTAVRNLATGEILFKDAAKVAFKEIKIGLIAGATVGAVSMLKVIFIDGSKPIIGIVVFISMFLAIMFSNMLGGIIPIFSQKIGIDPAVMASSVLTTVMDAASLFIFFNIASLVLKI